MLAELDIFKNCLLSLSRDERITVWHLAIVFGILQLATNDAAGPVYISRKKVMQASRIGSIVTYHKCMKELQLFGYIRYTPSYHPGIRSVVYLIQQERK